MSCTSMTAPASSRSRIARSVPNAAARCKGVSLRVRASRMKHRVSTSGSVVDERNSGTYRLPEIHFDQTGTYRLFVRSYGSLGGPFTIGLSDQPIESLPPLVLGVPQADALSPCGDVDDWPFSGTAGQIVSFLGDTASTTDSRIRLLDAATRTVLVTGTATTATDADDSEIVNFELPATGDYLLQVYTESIADMGTPNYTVTAQ